MVSQLLIVGICTKTIAPGFAAFLMMTIFAIADIVTGSLGKDLVINEFIFNSFLWLVLGSFGIGSIDKWINKKKGSDEVVD